MSLNDRNAIPELSHGVNDFEAQGNEVKVGNVIQKTFFRNDIYENSCIYATKSSTITAFSLDTSSFSIDIPVGTLIHHGLDAYRIQEYLASGGFGQIYRADLNGQNVVLKIAVGKLACTKLLREAEIGTRLAQLNLSVHPLRILQGAQIETEIADAYIVATMRDLTGVGSRLTNILESSNDLPSALSVMDLLLRVIEPIHEAEGLHYLHADVSPDNILLVPMQNTAVFIDFGNAQALDGNGQTEGINRDQLAFNPIYSAPELKAFFESDRKSIQLTKAYDVYCLGLILYGLLFEPLTESTAEYAALLARNRVNERQKEGWWNRIICELLVNFFHDCLSEDVSRRIPDIPTLRARLALIQQISTSYENYSLNRNNLSERIYQQLVVQRNDTFDVGAEEISLAQADESAIFKQASPRDQLALADYYAMSFILNTIGQASVPIHLNSINHIWPQRIIELMRELPENLLVDIESNIKAIINTATSAEIDTVDLLPCNLFALTGNSEWAGLSVQVANRWFHEVVLDGYFVSGCKVVLFDDVKHKRDMEFDLGELIQQSRLSYFCSRCSLQTLVVLAADFRYGFRASVNIDIAEALDAWLASSGLR